MEPLTGVTEYQMRAHSGSGGQLYTKELNAALGANYKGYVNAYASSQGGGQYYDDKKNGAAARAAQWIGMIPSSMFWSGKVSAGDAEVVDGQFWWLPKQMTPYEQYSTPPHTRLGV